MHRHTPLLFSALALLYPAFVSRVEATATYNVIKEYSGQTFFDDWNYYDHFDNLTNGDVIFVSQSVGQSSQLTYVDSATNHAIIKVDNTSNVPFNEKRNTVRIESKDLYGLGTLWVADIYHVPYGCSVWPAWWSQAPAWPAGGEIDIMESVNLRTQNNMGLHTLPGCTQVNPVQSSTQVQSTNCDSSANGNEGCITVDPDTKAFGADFANAGGGVWVTEVAESGISIWFYTRSQVPSVLSSSPQSIDTSALGTPVGNWPSGGCDMNKFISDQQLIFDITLCGDFAGNKDIFAQTCSGTCYTDYVVGNGSAYANAYFEIGSVRIFSSNPGATTLASGSGSGSATGSASAASNTSGSGSGSGNGAELVKASMTLLGLGAGLVVALFGLLGV